MASAAPRRAYRRARQSRRARYFTQASPSSARHRGADDSACQPLHRRPAELRLRRWNDAPPVAAPTTRAAVHGDTCSTAVHPHPYATDEGEPGYYWRGDIAGRRPAGEMRRWPAADARCSPSDPTDATLTPTVRRSRRDRIIYVPPTRSRPPRGAAADHLKPDRFRSDKMTEGLLVMNPTELPSLPGPTRIEKQFSNCRERNLSRRRYQVYTIADDSGRQGAQIYMKTVPKTRSFAAHRLRQVTTIPSGRRMVRIAFASQQRTSDDIWCDLDDQPCGTAPNNGVDKQPPGRRRRKLVFWTIARAKRLRDDPTAQPVNIRSSRG